MSYDSQTADMRQQRISDNADARRHVKEHSLGDFSEDREYRCCVDPMMTAAKWDAIAREARRQRCSTGVFLCRVLESFANALIAAQGEV